MLLEIICENIVLYTMAGIFSAGLLSRMCLGGFYRRLQRDICCMANPKNKLLRQIKLKYESCNKLEMQISNTVVFVRRNICEYRILGFSLHSIEKMLGQALFLDVLIGSVAVCYAWRVDLGQEVILLYSAVTMLFAATLYNYDKLSDIAYRRRVVEIGIVDFLENHLKIHMLQAKDAENAEMSEVSGDEEGKAVDKNKVIDFAGGTKQADNEAEAVVSAEDSRIIQEVLREFFG